ncbi:MAG: chloride channel protein [Armatimonadota bacterium]|nr:MAG: chloride channel protein [Armatimonadota bacterium]
MDSSTARLGREPVRLRALRFFHESNTTGPILLALVVGLGAGLGAVAFRWLITSINRLFFSGLGGTLFPVLGRFNVVVIPAAGGVIVGLLTYYLAREAKGHGVPEVMAAVSLRGGRIRPRVSVIKALASSVCIGSGGSAGREGPIVQIGSALGSTLAQVLSLAASRTRLLVACGAAGGISATFNAPIAGVIFALEVILREFTARYFGLVVLSSVAAAAVSQSILGDYPAFRSPQYSLVSVWELPLYFALGMVAAAVALLFVRGLYGIEDIADRWKFPEYLKPAVGGLLVGLIGVWYPQVFGVGYETIDAALIHKLTLGTALALVALKLLATSLTIGSGGSGGVFAPSLFLGAMTGSAFGEIVHRWLPDITAQSGAYALVGMAAVFAGAAHAPITSVLILFEMTRDYHIILPLMIAVVVSTLLSEALSRESIYTIKLVRRGIDISGRATGNPLERIPVSEAMTPDVATIPDSATVEELISRIESTGEHGLPVVDDRGRLTGIVSVSDITDAGPDAGDRVGDIATLAPATVHPDDPLSEAAKRFASLDVAQLPVVDRLRPDRLVGMLRRRDIIRTYGQATADQSALRQRVEQMKVASPGARFVHLRLAEKSPGVGKHLAELDLPGESVIVSVERGGRILFPHGDTDLRPGDRVVAFTSAGAEKAVRAALAGEPSASRARE